MSSISGLIAVDKKGGKVLFLNPTTFETEVVIEGLEKNPHELLVVPERRRAYIPIFGDGIHGRNPHPHHLLCVFDLEKRALLTSIDLRPCVSPHTLRLGPDGCIYVTCESSSRVAVIDPASNRVIGSIDPASHNCHRLVIAPDGRRLYTENEEDSTISVIDLPGRRLIGKIDAPRPLAGIAVSPDSKTIVAVDDTEPVLFLISAQSGQLSSEVRLKDVARAAQIVRYAPDGTLLVVTSMNSDTVSIVDSSFSEQMAISVGSQPMDMAFRGDELFIACQGDGTIHIIDLSRRRHKFSFAAGTGCECLEFFSLH